jgi:pimeloyl-ACP methyl ester carboxylesterase
MATTRYAFNGSHSLAYQVIGDDGPALLFVPGFVSNLEMQWEHAPIARFLDALASGNRLVLFDKLGTGLSDRLFSDPASLPESVADVRAVLDHAGIEHAHIFAISEGGPLALAFAAAHPERTASLCIYGSFACEAFGHAERARAHATFVRDGWGTGRTFGRLAPSWNDAASRVFLARYERQSATPTAAEQLVARAGELDVRPMLADVAVRTLVLHRADDPIISVDRSRLLADALADARLVELPGDDHLVYAGDTRRILDEMRAFIGSTATARATDRVFAAIAFIDIVESTDRANRLGDGAWRDLLDSFHRTVHRSVCRHGGQLVNTLGDGVLATFPTGSAAVQWSSAVCADSASIGLQVRIGLHASEVERRGRDLAGIGLHVAARVAGCAEPGRVTVTSTIRDVIDGSGVELRDVGSHSLRGIERPWQLFTLDTRSLSPF